MDRRRWNHVLSAGLAASGGAGLLLAIVNPASLQLSRFEIVGYGLTLLVTAGLVGLVDPAALAQRSRRRLIDPAPISLTPEPPAPRPDRSETYAELWDEEPELPAAEADRWEAFVDRAAEVNHTANDDLAQIDGWYEAPPPPRHRHRRPPP